MTSYAGIECHTNGIDINGLLFFTLRMSVPRAELRRMTAQDMAEYIDNWLKHAALDLTNHMAAARAALTVGWPNE